MDREQIIREIASAMCYHGINGYICNIDKNPCDCDCMWKEPAEAIYNAGYRKVPDGAVVLLIGKNNQALDEKTIEYFVKHNEQVRKETAKEILNRINEYNLDYNWDLKKEFKKLCKDYSVEVKNDIFGRTI